MCLSDIFYTLYINKAKSKCIRCLDDQHLCCYDFSGIVHNNLQNVFMYAIMPNCVCSLLKNKNILTHKTVGWAYSAFQMECSCLLNMTKTNLCLSYNIIVCHIINNQYNVCHISCPYNTILLESLLLRCGFHDFVKMKNIVTIAYLEAIKFLVPWNNRKSF